MRLILPGIENIFETEIDKINTIVIENQRLYRDVINDLYQQSIGDEGLAVLSEEGKELSIEKNLEMLACFVPFEINRKNLQNKAISQIVQQATQGDNYISTMELLSMLEQYILDITNDMRCDLTFSKFSMDSIVKSVGIEFNEVYSSLPEKIIDYFELVTEFDRKKLFVTNNLRSYVDDDELELFAKSVLLQGYNVIMIESSEHSLIEHERRYIVDSSLCEIKE